MPVQLKTLLPLFAVFILLFLVARHFLIPDSFGKYGHYRADAIEENGSISDNYAGKDKCIECHEDIAALQLSDAHSVLSCEICHGPGAAHSENYENLLEKPGSKEWCGRCHSLHPARNAEIIIQIDMKNHYPEKTNCIDCHNPHAVWELKE